MGLFDFGKSDSDKKKETRVDVARANARQTPEYAYHANYMAHRIVNSNLSPEEALEKVRVDASRQQDLDDEANGVVSRDGPFTWPQSVAYNDILEMVRDMSEDEVRLAVAKRFFHPDELKAFTQAQERAKAEAAALEARRSMDTEEYGQENKSPEPTVAKSSLGKMFGKLGKPVMQVDVEAATAAATVARQKSADRD